jgi:two-component SAPR family response regulator
LVIIHSINGLEIAGQCKNAIEALDVLHQKTVDVIFLDIKNAAHNHSRVNVRIRTKLNEYDNSYSSQRYNKVHEAKI